MFNISKSIWHSIMTQSLCSKSHYNLIICSDFIRLVPVKMYPSRYLLFFLLTLHTEEIHHTILRSYHIIFLPVKFIKKQFAFYSYLFSTILPAASLLLFIGILEGTNSIKNTFVISSSFPGIHKSHSTFWSETSTDSSVLSTHAAAFYQPAHCCLHKITTSVRQ